MIWLVNASDFLKGIFALVVLIFLLAVSSRAFLYLPITFFLIILLLIKKSTFGLVKALFYYWILYQVVGILGNYLSFMELFSNSTCLINIPYFGPFNNWICLRPNWWFFGLEIIFVVILINFYIATPKGESFATSEIEEES